MVKKKKQDTEETSAKLSQTNEASATEPIEEDLPEPEETLETGLRRELDAAQAEISKNWDLYLRERAELENFRKRTQREKEDAIRFANDRLLKEMIPVLDNLERAIDHACENSTEQKGLIEGVDMTINMFRKVLEDFGVTPVNATGEPFDPSLHQAMGQVESTEHPPNTVVTEFQKGYLLNDRLLRPALVMVSKTPAETSTDQEKAGDTPKKDSKDS